MQDNLVSHVPRVYVQDKKSGKTGTQYSTITTEFMLPNGEVYPLELFLNSEQRALVSMSVALSGDLQD